MKSVLISIHPKWCELIASGEKTIEVRKTCPKCEAPIRAYIYETKAQFVKSVREACTTYGYGRGKVIGEFVCDAIERFDWEIQPPSDNIAYPTYFDCYEGYAEELYYKNGTCLSYKEIREYGKKKTLYTWRISELKIYDKPKELSDFWAYNEELHKRHDIDDDGYCCYDALDCNGEAMTDCGDAYQNILNCYHCWNEWSGWCHKVSRPPQSWCYVEELSENYIKSIKETQNDHQSRKQ